MARSRITDSIRKEEVTHGYVFGVADELEMYNDEGEKVLDLDKVAKLIETFSKANNMPVCLFDLNGNI